MRESDEVMVPKGERLRKVEEGSSGGGGVVSAVVEDESAGAAAVVGAVICCCWCWPRSVRDELDEEEGREGWWVPGGRALIAGARGGRVAVEEECMA